ESAMLGQHRLNFLRDELPIVRMYEREIFLGSRWFVVWIQAMNHKQLGRPLLETGGTECPATGVREPLSLRKEELRSFAFLYVEIHANPIQSNPIQSNPIQSNTIRFHPSLGEVPRD